MYKNSYQIRLRSFVVSITHAHVISMRQSHTYAKYNANNHHQNLAKRFNKRFNCEYMCVLIMAKLARFAKNKRQYIRDFALILTFYHQ